MARSPAIMDQNHGGGIKGPGLTSGRARRPWFRGSDEPMAADRNRKMLQVIEDDALARQGLAFLLVKEGYEVALSANGREALDYLDANPPPDLILLDMLMPVMDGWHFLDELKRKGHAAPPAPVIIT